MWPNGVIYGVTHSSIRRYPIVSHWIRRGASKEGMWPDWWRPVSLLYGGDLAVHDYFDHLDELINQVGSKQLDRSKLITKKL